MKPKSYEDFLDYSVTSQENSVEIYFCKPLDEKGDKRQLTEDESRIFMILMMISDDEVSKMYEEIQKASFISKIITSRAEYAGLKMDKKTAIMLSIICQTPGEAVMYVYYLLYKAKQLGVKEIDFETLGKSIFPWGFFSEETLNLFWDEQKIKKKNTDPGTDNLLDYSNASSSLRILG